MSSLNWISFLARLRQVTTTGILKHSPEVQDAAIFPFKPTQNPRPDPHEKSVTYTRRIRNFAQPEKPTPSSPAPTKTANPGLLCPARAMLPVVAPFSFQLESEYTLSIHSLREVVYEPNGDALRSGPPKTQEQ